MADLSQAPARFTATPGWRRLSALLVSIPGLFLLRSLALAVESPWPLVGLIIVGTCCLYLAFRLKRQVSVFHARDELKDLAGAEVLVLIILAPHWWSVLRAEPLAIVLLSLPLAAHASGALIRALQSDRSRIHALLSNLFPSRMAPVLITELGILLQALLFWRRAKVGPGHRSFTSYGTLAPALIAVMAISVVEILILHLILSRFSIRVATIVTVIGAVGFAYMLGLLKSLQSLPTVVGPDEVIARLGGLQEVRFNKREMAEVVLLPPAAALPSGTTKLSGISSPNVLIRMREPVRMRGPFGQEREVTSLALRLDREKEFVASLS